AVVSECLNVRSGRPSSAKRDDSGLVCRIHIGRSVANVGGLRGRDAPAFKYSSNIGGLDVPFRGAALDSVKVLSDSHTLERDLGRYDALTGDYGAPDSAIAQSTECIVDSRKWISRVLVLVPVSLHIQLEAVLPPVRHMPLDYSIFARPKGRPYLLIGK